MKWFGSSLFLSSSPRPLARKGKPTNVIVWITLTAQSLESQHWTMELYSINELTDMHLVYGAAYQSRRRAARMYAERFPQRRNLAHTMFQRLDQWLHERGSLCPNMSETGQSHSLIPDVEEAILSGRTAFHQLTWNCTSCWVKPEHCVVNSSWATIVPLSSATCSVF